MNNTQPSRICAVHLDLKGLPPTPERLMQLIPVFAAAGYNAILVEWEDMFPWTVDKRFRCSTAYTKQQILDFCQKSADFGLQIIPLVQSLAHMETFLTIPENISLRECSDRSDVLNPLAENAQKLIKELVDDVLRLIPTPKYFHLGGDEALLIGSNELTKMFIDRHGKGALYIKHLEPLWKHLNRLGIKPLLWNDMFNELNDDILLKMKDNVELVVWGYNGTPYDSTPATYHYNIRFIKRLRDLGFNLWGASAYKGADGYTADLPVIQNRKLNASAWATVAKEFNFNGLIATAWSRYSTHRPQNEPIDAALDSLFIIGKILNGQEEDVFECYELLNSVDQLTTFKLCYDAMSKFSTLRKELWSNIQFLHEQTTIEETHPAYRESKISQITLDEVHSQYDLLLEHAKQVSKVFFGLVYQDSIYEYLNIRICAIEKQIALLQNTISHYPSKIMKKLNHEIRDAEKLTLVLTRK